MITIDTEYYCDGCPEFEPCAITQYEGCEVYCTLVRCEHSARCRNIAAQIENKIRGGAGNA